MSIESIENAMHQGIQELFATASLDKMSGDMEGYRVKLGTIGQIAELLGIDTEIMEITISLKQEESGSE